MSVAVGEKNGEAVVNDATESVANDAAESAGDANLRTRIELTVCFSGGAAGASTAGTDRATLPAVGDKRRSRISR